MNFSPKKKLYYKNKILLIKQGKVNKNFKPLILTPPPQNFSLILQNIKVDLNNFVTTIPVFEKQS